MHKITTLKKRADFLSAANSGLRRGTTSFNLQANANSLNQIRVGYTVSKRVSKLAVVRNRIKRRLKAATLRGFENATAGFDYVLIGKLEAKERDMNLLIGDIKYAVRKIHAPQNI